MGETVAVSVAVRGRERSERGLVVKVQVPKSPKGGRGRSNPWVAAVRLLCVLS